MTFPTRLSSFAMLAATLAFLNPATSGAAETYVPFAGEKSAWHEGFDRYDFVMDEETLAITPSRRRKARSLACVTRPKGNGGAL